MSRVSKISEALRRESLGAARVQEACALAAWIPHCTGRLVFAKSSARDWNILFYMEVAAIRARRQKTWKILWRWRFSSRPRVWLSRNWNSRRSSNSIWFMTRQFSKCQQMKLLCRRQFSTLLSIKALFCTTINGKAKNSPNARTLQLTRYTRLFLFPEHRCIRMKPPKSSNWRILTVIRFRTSLWHIL